MRVDGVRNYQQKPNFGAIQIQEKAYKDFGASINYILLKLQVKFLSNPAFLMLLR